MFIPVPSYVNAAITAVSIGQYLKCMGTYGTIIKCKEAILFSCTLFKLIYSLIEPADVLLNIRIVICRFSS